MALVRRDIRAHSRQWLNDPVHRPRTKRPVANEHRVERLSRQKAHEQAGRGAAVSAIERFKRRLETSWANSQNGQGILRLVDGYAKFPEAIKRR